MCWDFVGTTIEKVKVSCKLQSIVFNFIITFSTKGVLKWRMFGMYLEIGLHISYISHWNWKETVTYIYWTALFLDHKRPSCMPLTFLIMKISYWIYAANNLGKNVSWIYIFWYLIYHANTSWSWSVGEYNLVEIYICIEYILPTIWGIYVSLIYILVGYIMQTVGGMNVSWVVSVRPSGAELGNIYISKYIFVLDICSKRFWENM